MNYKVGDKLKIVNENYGPGYCGLVVEVVPKGKCTSASEGVWIDKHTAEVDWVNESWNLKDFELVEEEKVKNRFAVGDKVISIKNTPDTEEGFIGFIVQACEVDYDWEVKPLDGGLTKAFNEDELELLSFGPNSALYAANITPQDIAGIARPVLEERKIGKVKMELFDEGFPNAIMEIARVMTWAAEHKGYKPHDWKNLPNADTEFSAAASRHKVKSFIQKVEGIEPLQRTDEESKISHLAHQAFNVLAELELVLTGVIK